MRHFAVIYLFFLNRHSLVEMDTLFYKEPAIIYHSWHQWHRTATTEKSVVGVRRET